MIKEIDLLQRFHDEICTFEMAKKVSKKGMTCANIYLAYDERGEIGNGAWLQSITGGIFYPAIQFPFAVLMLADLPDYEKIKVNENISETAATVYKIEYKELQFDCQNLVDGLLDVWCKYAPDIKG